MKSMGRKSVNKAVPVSLVHGNYKNGEPFAHDQNWTRVDNRCTYAQRVD